MTRTHINSFPNELLVLIFWPKNRSVLDRPNDYAAWDSLCTKPRFIQDDPSYQRDNSLFPGLNAEAIPFSDTAFDLLLAAICRRWRHLAKRHVVTLVVKKDLCVSRQELSAAVSCFPRLTHLHLSDVSVETIDDAFLAHLAASCPDLTAFHVGTRIVRERDSARIQEGDERLLTAVGFEHLFLRCTRLEHLTLDTLPSDLRLPPAFFRLADLQTLAVADASLLKRPELTDLSSLAALSIATTIVDFEDLSRLVRLSRLTRLALHEQRMEQLSDRSPAATFSFAQLSSLLSLDLAFSLPPFRLMFPPGPGSPCSRLERLRIADCLGLEQLPNNLGDLLPSLQELSISDCQDFSHLPEHLASFRCLQTLNISNCEAFALPENFGDLPALQTLVLDGLSVSDLPASFCELKLLETLLLADCEELQELPAGFAGLTSLKSLSLAGLKRLAIPDDIGELVNLHTFYVKGNYVQQLLPPSFTRLASLTRLELDTCFIPELPERVGVLRSLQELFITSCPMIKHLPESVTELLHLRVLRVGGCSGLSSVPRRFDSLTRLKHLELSECKLLAEALESLPESLKTLTLGNRTHVTLLLEFRTLPKLRNLCLNIVLFCVPPASTSVCGLQQLELVLAGEQDLPFPLSSLPHLRTLTIHSLGTLTSLSGFSGSSFPRLRELSIVMPGLAELPAAVTSLQQLTSLHVVAPRLVSLPRNIGVLSRLRVLKLSDCSSLEHLPASLTDLSCLRELDVSRTAIRSLPPNLARLSGLRSLNFSGCRQLETVPVL